MSPTARGTLLPFASHAGSSPTGMKQKVTMNIMHAVEMPLVHEMTFKEAYQLRLKKH